MDFLVAVYLESDTPLATDEIVRVTAHFARMMRELLHDRGGPDGEWLPVFYASVLPALEVVIGLPVTCTSFTRGGRGAVAAVDIASGLCVLFEAAPDVAGRAAAAATARALDHCAGALAIGLPIFAELLTADVRTGGGGGGGDEGMHIRMGGGGGGGGGGSSEPAALDTAAATTQRAAEAAGGGGGTREAALEAAFAALVANLAVSPTVARACDAEAIAGAQLFSNVEALWAVEFAGCPPVSFARAMGVLVDLLRPAGAAPRGIALGALRQLRRAVEGAVPGASAARRMIVEWVPADWAAHATALAAMQARLLEVGVVPTACGIIGGSRDPELVEAAVHLCVAMLTGGPPSVQVSGARARARSGIMHLSDARGTRRARRR